MLNSASLYLVWQAAAKASPSSAPPLIILLVVAMFALAGARLLQLRRNPASPGDGFAALLFTAFAVIGGWIALSPEAQGCTVGFGGTSIGETAGAGCRVPFGIGAIITGAVAVYAGARWAKRRTRRVQ